MKTGIAIAVLLILVGSALFYVIRAKRRGAKCVGCPYAKACGGMCSCAHQPKGEEKK